MVCLTSVKDVSYPADCSVHTVDENDGTPVEEVRSLGSHSLGILTPAGALAH